MLQGVLVSVAMREGSGRQGEEGVARKEERIRCCAHGRRQLGTIKCKERVLALEKRRGQLQ